jgi:hypothetical protein
MPIRALVFLIISSFLVGCASTGPTKDEIQQAVKGFAFKPVSDGKARLYIYYSMRNKEMGDIAFRYQDESKYLGKVFHGEHTTFELPAGEQTIIWRGYGQSNRGQSSDSDKFKFIAGETYIFNVVHGTIFNRYSDDGLSLISSLKLRKNKNKATYYLSKTVEAKNSEACLQKRTVSLFRTICL